MRTLRSGPGRGLNFMGDDTFANIYMTLAVSHIFLRCHL